MAGLNISDYYINRNVNTLYNPDHYRHKYKGEHGGIASTAYEDAYAAELRRSVIPDPPPCCKPKGWIMTNRHPLTDKGIIKNFPGMAIFYIFAFYE